MYKKLTAVIASQTFELYYVGFRSQSRITATPTISSGLYRTLSGSSRNQYTLKGRAAFSDMPVITSFINFNIGTKCLVKLGNINIGQLMLTDGEVYAEGNGMCEYTLRLEEAENG